MIALLFFLLFSLNTVLSETECPYVASNIPTDRRSDTTKLRLVQYNVEWLFIDYYSPMNCPGNGCSWKNQSDAIIHMDNIYNVVKELNPDIINFCEVEGCDELNTLKDKLNSSYASYLVKGTDTSTGQNVGMLTRIDPHVNLYRTELKYAYPVAGSLCGYTGQNSSSGVSKHFITEFLFNDYLVALISAHLIAIPTDPSRCSQREAQASVLQKMIGDYIHKGYEIIVMGDFNDYDSTVMDANNNKPISSVLDILKGYKGDLAGTYELHNVAEEIVKKERYSDWWDSDNNCETTSPNDYSMIDHILVTDLLKKYIANVFIYHNYAEYCGKYNSDHYPVVVDFQM